MATISRDLNSLLSSRNVNLEKLDSSHMEVLRLGQELDGCWIAGGAPLALYRGTLNEIKDWDLFFDSDENRLEAQNSLRELGFVESLKSKWSVSFEKDGVLAQTITIKNYESAEEIFNNFDISVCCFAIEDNHMTYSQQAQEDVENMLLHFINTNSPVICMKRVAKYAAKGFKLTNQFVVDFLNRVKQLPDIEENEGFPIRLTDVNRVFAEQEIRTQGQEFREAIRNFNANFEGEMRINNANDVIELPIQRQVVVPNTESIERVMTALRARTNWLNEQQERIQRALADIEAGNYNPIEIRNINRIPTGDS